jgi:hypothetical protein
MNSKDYVISFVLAGDLTYHDNEPYVCSGKSGPGLRSASRNVRQVEGGKNNLYFINYRPYGIFR